MEQRTQEWFEARLGKVTASRISDVLAKPTTAAYQNYQAQIISERLTGERAEQFVNAAMEWGTEQEPNARRAYEFIADCEVAEEGFVDHPAIIGAGASPDGLVGDVGLIEIKCPNTATHLRFLQDGKIEPKYARQMYWQMACTGREWCDFVSYDPRLPDKFGFRIVRQERCDKTINELEAAVEAFLSDIDGAINDLNRQYS